MQKRIKGNLYSTRTASIVHFRKSHTSVGDLRYYSESLYRKKDGEFFLYGYGGPLTGWGKMHEDGALYFGEDIIPLDLGAAKIYLASVTDLKAYSKVFPIDDAEINWLQEALDTESEDGFARFVLGDLAEVQKLRSDAMVDNKLDYYDVLGRKVKEAQKNAEIIPNPPTFVDFMKSDIVRLYTEEDGSRFIKFEGYGYITEEKSEKPWRYLSFIGNIVPLAQFCEDKQNLTSDDWNEALNFGHHVDIEDCNEQRILEIFTSGYSTEPLQALTRATAAQLPDGFYRWDWNKEAKGNEV